MGHFASFGPPLSFHPTHVLVLQVVFTTEYDGTTLPEKSSNNNNNNKPLGLEGVPLGIRYYIRSLIGWPEKKDNRSRPLGAFGLPKGGGAGNLPKGGAGNHAFVTLSLLAYIWASTSTHQLLRGPYSQPQSHQKNTRHLISWQIVRIFLRILLLGFLFSSKIMYKRIGLKI